MDGAGGGDVAIALKTIPLQDAQLRELQQNVADAVGSLDAKPAPVLGVLTVSASRSLVGNEDVVLVDASSVPGELALVLPSPRVLTRRITVHVVKAGPSPVTIKAVDLATATSPTINGAAKVSIPSGQEGTLTVVSDGRVFVAY